MKIEKMRLTNFLSYRGDNEIDLGNASICAIIGQNGAGKSSLLEAITYALFGQTRASSEDELGYGYNSEHKRWLVEKFGVDLKIGLGGYTYLIQRHRHQKKGGYLRVEQYVEVSGPSGWVVEGVREAQDVITKILGMDYEAFISSVIMRQDDYEAFMKMAPGAAKEVLMKIIGIGQFEDKRIVAADKAKDIAMKLSGVEAVIQSNITELQSTGDTELEHQELKQQTLDIAKEINQKQVECEASEKNLEKMKADLAKFHESIEQIESLNKELAPMGPMITKKENELDRLIHASAMKLEDILKTSPEQWASGAAITEGNIITATERQKVLRDQAVKGDTMLIAYRNEIKELTANPRACLLGKDECNGTLKTQCAGKIEEVTKKGLALKADMDKVTIEQDQIGVTLESERVILAQEKAAYTVAADMPMLKTWKESRDRITTTKTKLELYIQDNRNSTQDDAKALEYEIRGYKNGIKKLQDEATEVQKQIGRIEERRAARKKLEEDTEKLKMSKPALKESLFVYETLKKALSKDGIPALMIETVVPQLESHANELLDKLSNGQIRVEFRLQKKLKSGGYSDSFEIYVTDEQGTRSVTMYSGGEKYRIILAIHSAFSRYLIHRSGTPLKFLCIDEPTGLDDQGIERFVETLGGLREGYEQIFVITHLKSLVEYFPQTLMVEKTSMGSTVKAIGLQDGEFKAENKTGKKPALSYDL